ncbi:hypothetical protein [Allomesorhizobium camelthorni]|uniref:Uncharacterized protein n=1 Tax=Allomesorhizobium camelthorni TaxID=475069 RepID=A0A6G4WII6_9HYPH|nr:hypothetical protein [Mesorhizobium camelthorni]NGO54013.1 hypothetical protein [Mesorhizobium camelthorni]
MTFRICLPHIAVALITLSAPATVLLGAGSAEAAVYCKTVGVPKGCVVRPTVPAARVVVTPAPVVVAPAPVVVAPVVVAPRVGVGVGAPGVGVAPGRVGNRGGPVNRVGRR